MGCCFGKEKGTLAGAAGSRFAQLSPPPASAQHARLTGADPDGELSEGSPGDSSAQQRFTSYYGAEEDDVALRDLRRGVVKFNQSFRQVRGARRAAARRCFLPVPN